MTQPYQINVGGIIFNTTKNTLSLSPFLEALLEKWNPPPGNALIFLDRDPSAFKHILRYLRNQNYKVPEKWASEMNFYGLTSEKGNDVEQKKELNEQLQTPIWYDYDRDPYFYLYPCTRIINIRRTSFSDDNTPRSMFKVSSFDILGALVVPQKGSFITFGYGSPNYLVGEDIPIPPYIGGVAPLTINLVGDIETIPVVTFINRDNNLLGPVGALLEHLWGIKFQHGNYNYFNREGSMERISLMPHSMRPHV